MERKHTAAYLGILAAAFAIALFAGYSLQLLTPLDRAAYDLLVRLDPPHAQPPQSILLAIDEDTLEATRGGMHGIRVPLAQVLKLVAEAKPKAVALDVILADHYEDENVDRELASALCANRSWLVLASQIKQNGNRWEDPVPEFAECAAAIGHVHAAPDESDSRTREIPLLKRFGKDRRWAIALEAFRISQGDPQPPIESEDGLQVGRAFIPVPDRGRFGRRKAESQGFGTERRLMLVRFLPRLPSVSLIDLLNHQDKAAQFRDKVVFIGGNTRTEAVDRLFTPANPDEPTTGLEIHAQAFETLNQRLFLTPVSDTWVFLFCVVLAAAIGLAFRFLPGWRAYVTGIAALLAAAVMPYVFFTHNRVFSFAMPTMVAWIMFGVAAMWYHLVVRRYWLAEQSQRARYQQTLHFVTHEMRTPLSSIQGSSELITRYQLTDEKRKQIASLINSESKRLARMVEIFLNVERLSAGQMELKREPISVRDLVETCVERVRPLGERKHITITLQPIADDVNLTGDRELMEYACYNLLTNAVKYSPQRTEVTVTGWKESGQIRIAVKDQGIGMDQKEVKQIFRKFYRTKKAEESGEAGTGIGLSIVQQIVEQHGGRIDVTSRPGAGSCFTLVLPAASEVPRPAAAQRH
jgi:signal transduction histidine kinase